MRKLGLLAALVMAVMAFSSSSAFAQNPVEIEDALNGGHCNPCALTITSDLAQLEIDFGLFEVHYTCDVDFTANVGEDGHGDTTGAVPIRDETGGTGNCTQLTACELPWESQITHDGAGTEYLDGDVCISGPFGVTCEGELETALIKTGENYSAELDHIQLEGDESCSFTGHYTLTDPDRIEIMHL